MKELLAKSDIIQAFKAAGLRTDFVENVLQPLPAITSPELSIGDVVYTVASLEIGYFPPYRYQIYVAEKKISKVEMSRETTIYTAGKYNECEFILDPFGRFGRRILRDEDGEITILDKEVYLNRSEAVKNRNALAKEYISKGKEVVVD